LHGTFSATLPLTRGTGDATRVITNGEFDFTIN
jgi:hypothetical protein